MNVPQLTPIQWLILDIVGMAQKEGIKGRDLRARLAARGLKKSGPGFYQIMARLEAAGMVKGWYEQEIIDGQIVRERRYEILGKGSRAAGDTRKFFTADAAGVPKNV